MFALLLTAATTSFAATCSPATSAGTAPASWQTYCWFDMSSYVNAQVFGGGQAFTITLSDGSVLSFTLSATSTGNGLRAAAAPAWSGAATGNTAFLGIPGRPILYTTAGGTVNLTMSNIQLTPPAGVVASGQYKLVVADAESSNNGESLRFVTNGGAWELVDDVPPISGSLYPTISGTGTSTFNVTGVSGTVGAYIMGSNSPSQVDVRLVAGGLQGIMFALQYSTVSVRKIISGTRANSSDQFTYRVLSTGNSAVLATATSTGSGAGPFGSAVATLSSGVDVTVEELMAAGSVSNLQQYSSSLTCTNGASGSPTVVPTGLAANTYRLGSTSYGDAIACTFTNTARPATVALSKITSGAIGGSFTFTSTNLASAPPAVTTTAPGVATPAAPVARTVSALNTAVTITETPAAGFVASSVSCTDANATVTGNPATFGTLAGNVITIAATNIRAAAQITCTLTNTVNKPTVAVQKVTLGAAGGAFSFSSTNLAATLPAITTTSTSSAAPITLVPVPVTTTGSAVTITETLASNFTIVSAECVDTNAGTSGNPAGTFGTLAGQVLTIPATFVIAQARIVCTFTNIVDPAIPQVAVQKITNTIAGGPFSFTATNLTGTVADITTTAPATAAPTTPNFVTVTSISTAVTLTETANTNFDLTGATCTDTNAAQSGNPASFGTFSGSTVTIPVANLATFARIVCTFTNTPKAPTFAIQKMTLGAFGGPFSFNATNLAASLPNVSTLATSTTTPAVPSTVQVSAANTDIVVTEVVSPSFAITSAACSDVNSAFTGNPASFGTLSGNVLTVPAANVLPAAQIRCVFTNTARPATVTVLKTTTGAAGGPFAFSVANLGSAPPNVTTLAASTPAPSSPTPLSVTTLNSQVQISEGTSSLFTISSASCTDANAAVTGNTGTFGSRVGLLLTIPAANILPAAQITCTFTNAGNAPRISLQKALLGTGRLAASDQFTLSITGTGAPASITTTGTAATITSSALSFTATAGSAYTLTETMAAGSASAITAYAKTVVCTNANASGTNVSSIVTIPIAFTAQAADNISCTIRNNGTATPLLAMVKTSSAPSSSVAVGQTVTYTYAITNNGNVSVSNVQVNDLHGTPPVSIPVGAGGITNGTLTVPGPLGAGASPGGSTPGVWQTLAPGATVQFTYTHTVTQAEIDKG